MRKAVVVLGATLLLSSSTFFKAPTPPPPSLDRVLRLMLADQRQGIPFDAHFIQGLALRLQCSETTALVLALRGKDVLGRYVR